MHSTSHTQYLAPCCKIAVDAGKLIMTYYTGQFTTRHKEDKSPVTDADIAANNLIVKALAELAPDIPIIAEEDEVLGEHGRELFWLVDPLDGTRSFVRGEPEFTVNIGLICQGAPVLGVIYVPAQGILYYGDITNGAFKVTGDSVPVAIRTRPQPAQGPVVVRSQSHPSPATSAYLEKLAPQAILASSSSAKFCLVAEGSADLYPRFGRTMEWDTAAGHAILNAAGGRVETVEGEVLTYGKPGFENPGFIAFGSL